MLASLHSQRDLHPRGRLHLRWFVCLLLASCAAVVETDTAANTDEDALLVDGVGLFEAALSTALLSANGTYGAACAGGRAGTTWSLALTMGATLDNSPLSVVKSNTACVLSLTALRTGAGTSNLYSAQTPVVLTASYPASGTLFTSPSDSFTASAKLSAVDFAAAFVLTVLTSSDPALVSGSSATQYTYEGYILANETPLSYWRLDEAPRSDDFAGTADTTLQTPRGSVTWTKSTASTTNAVLSDAGRVRASTAGKALYAASATQPSADYAVSADIYVRSLLSDDQAGVIARATAASDTYYVAGYVISNSAVGCLCQPKHWQLWKFVNGTGTVLGISSATLTVGNTYRVSLQVVGTSITVFVDGAQRIAVTDSSIATVGSPGVLLGLAGGSTQTNNAGLHVDNFSVYSLRAADAKGVNPGAYSSGVIVNDPGATNSVGNVAIKLNGASYVDVARTIADDFTIEFWYKATQGTGVGVTNWYNAAGIIDALIQYELLTIPLARSGFGVSVRSDGKVLAGAVYSYVCNVLSVCVDEATIVSSTTPAFNTWHHVAFTRNKASGALVLFIDGSSVGTATGPVGSTIPAAPRLNMGRIQIGTNYFTGSLDEVAIYSTVLSASAVLAHYQHR